MRVMCRKHLAVLFVFCLLFVFQVSAQDKDWKPITPEELAMKSSSVEPDADAEAIFWEVKLDDSSETEFKRTNYIRVKIFNERGREKFSKVDIPFLKGLKVKDVAARVIRADGSIVELKKEEIFEREIIKGEGIKIKAKSFAVPNIEPGVIIEYRYREVIEDGSAKGMRLAFQRDIPVQNLNYYYKPYNKREPNFQTFNMSRTNFVKDKDGFYLASQKNVPSFKQEPRMPPEDQVRPWMLLQGVGFSIVDASMFSYTYTIKDPSNPTVYWGGVTSERAPLYKAMTKSNKEIKAVADGIVASASTPDEKLHKLYDFCQTQVRNVNFDTKTTDNEKKEAAGLKTTSDVLKRRLGGAKDITLLFGALANAAGFETRLVFMGDRSEIFFNPEMTNENFIHFDAIAVKDGEGWKFFNPGLAFAPYGSLHWSDEGVWALLIGDNNYMWVKTPITDYSKSAAKRTAKLKLLEDGTLEGDVRLEYGGQLGVAYKMSSYDDSPNKREENLREEIKNRLSTAEISDLNIENVTDPQKPFTFSYKVRIPSYAQKTGKRIFLQPGFFEYGENPLFSSATRKYDVYFQYPWSEQDEIEIALPAGYMLDNADKPNGVADPRRVGVLEVSIGVDKDNTKLYYTRKFHFGGGGNTLFPANLYANLKNMFDAFQKVDTHTISLKQK